MSHLKGKKHRDSLLANGVTEEEKVQYTCTCTVYMYIKNIEVINFSIY